MKLPSWMPSRRKQTDAQPNVPTELEPYYESPRRQLIRRIIIVVLALLLIAAIMWAIIAVQNDVTNETGTNKESQTQSENKDNSKENNSNSGSRSDSDNKSAQSDNQASSRANQDQQASNQSSTGQGNKENSTTATEIPNTGPEEVAPIVLAASAIAIAAHHFVMRRRVQQ